MPRKQFHNIGLCQLLCASLRAAAAWLCLAGVASAQVNGNLTVVSEYRYRGIALSQGKPVAQIELNYDSPGGWYAGALASGAQFDSGQAEQLLAYGGYVRRLTAGLSWDAGVSRASFAGAPDYNYSEVFIGLTSETYSGRMYFSPSYFDQQLRTLYAEINATYLLSGNFYLLAHCGLLYPLTGRDNFFQSASRYDGRLALSAKNGDWNTQLAWVWLQKKNHRISTI